MTKKLKIGTIRKRKKMWKQEMINWKEMTKNVYCGSKEKVENEAKDKIKLIKQQKRETTAIKIGH